MYKVSDITNAIDRFAPQELAEKWDNPGLMVGDFEQEVTKVFICLDVTAENTARAAECGAELIVSHHPLIFTPMKRIVENDISGSIVRTLIKNDISVFSAHTNLDKADGGMNDALAEKLGLEDVRHFTDDECLDGNNAPLDNIGRIGRLDTPMELDDFTAYVKNILGCRSIRSVGSGSETVSYAALCSGAGGDGIYAAYRAGADVYVTSDIRHHEAQLASELGISLIDAGHFETENIICEFMSDYLQKEFPLLKIITSEAEPYFS